MAIRTVVTRGFGNGTFNGTIPLVVLRGYISSAVVAVTAVPIRVRMGAHGVLHGRGKTPIGRGL